MLNCKLKTISVVILILFSILYIMQKTEPKFKSLLTKVPEFLIDSQGTFKYIQIECKDERGQTFIFVRGHKNFTFHKQIFDKFMQELVKANFQTFDVIRIAEGKVLQQFKIKLDEDVLTFKCLGGGRMIHSSNLKKLEIYGYSKTYGQQFKVKHDQAVAQAIKYLKYSPNKVVISTKKY